MSLNIAGGSAYYVGVDWAAATHAVCVLDPAGKRVAAFTVEHSAAGLTALAARLARLGAAESMPVGIERPDGRVVDVLLEAGHPIVPVKPNAIKAWRDGEVLSGAKSDAGDAEVIAEYLRLRQHRLSLVAPYSAQTKALRTVVRTRGDLVQTRVATTNQLTALLDLHWPGAKAIFADIASPIALEFLTRYPTARHARQLGVKRLTAFCTRHGYSGRRTGEQLLARLRAAPAGVTDPTLCDAVRDAVLALVTVLRAITTAGKDLDRSVTATLGEHPDSEIFTSLPRSGQINAAQMLAEWGDTRQAYDGPDAVAALAGTTPVTKESGKHRAVHFRWACNKRFRVAVTTFADNSRRASPWAAKVYTDARTRGHDHPHAIRILARAWIRIIWRCWTDRLPYDPARHGNAVRLHQNEPLAA
ncbi:IS110 family transposase [Dactylosporangium aurantiacum]|uniref:IS110 family transposase n=1 Tax=Dactylosporangium aurantiacum TaxID=35754 RepID=A0A9Q9ID63_9ACTN|nr:IS110 family transposase [Dactylosporangium aurantiacum]MDG6110540.1 IS110 family transposase [Dactylosporangium aurantiacum]UWZ53867.1 IS110 family transposase [Dactylosporangium aurantiacum]